MTYLHRSASRYPSYDRERCSKKNGDKPRVVKRVNEVRLFRPNSERRTHELKQATSRSLVRVRERQPFGLPFGSPGSIRQRVE